MSKTIPASKRTELLVLARLAAKKPASEAVIAETLVKLAVPTATKREWKAKLATMLRRLQSQSLIVEERRPRSRTAKWMLTDAGRHVLAEAFGLKKAPTWEGTRDRHLPALALGLDANSRATAAGKRAGERLQAALLSRYFDLPHAETLSEALDALVAAELGSQSGTFTKNQLHAYFLKRRTEREIRGNAVDAAKVVASSAVRAANSRLNQLRPALIRRWLAGELIAAPAAAAKDLSGPETAASTRRDAPSAAPLDDGSFAAMVKHAVRAVGPNGRFGAHKVFVSAIWRNLAGDLIRHGMGLDDLKRRLLDANRAGLLSLARADLVGAMDPNEVKISEIVDRSSRFHFVIDASRLS